MAKVITFSREFPAYHPRKGEKTLFVEKILRGLNIQYQNKEYFTDLLKLNTVNLMVGKLTYDDLEKFWFSLQPVLNEKPHTIRGGNRFKPGEYFSPRVWSEKPYNSPQIIFAADIQINNVWDFVFVQADEFLTIGGCDYYPTGYDEMVKILAVNDGLSLLDFKAWFKKPFTGQIICWNENINY